MAEHNRYSCPDCVRPNTHAGLRRIDPRKPATRDNLMGHTDPLLPWEITLCAVGLRREELRR